VAKEMKSECTVHVSTNGYDWFVVPVLYSVSQKTAGSIPFGKDNAKSGYHQLAQSRRLSNPKKIQQDLKTVADPSQENKSLIVNRGQATQHVVELSDNERVVEMAEFEAVTDEANDPVNTIAKSKDMLDEDEPYFCVCISGHTALGRDMISAYCEHYEKLTSQHTLFMQSYRTLHNIAHFLRCYSRVIAVVTDYRLSSLLSYLLSSDHTNEIYVYWFAHEPLLQYPHVNFIFIFYFYFFAVQFINVLYASAFPYSIANCLPIAIAGEQRL
ncbi:hypothetical protein RFI_13528, partial [Reticulomyxa filosa]